MTMDARKYAMISCLIGSIIVWYDFVIFGIATAMVFTKLFFPASGFIMAALVYAVGFFSRPIGSLFFGWLGDKFGRKPTLVASLILTGLVTTAIGLLPTAEAIGAAAGALLFALRFLQTAALGGEWAATATIMTEYNLQSKRRVFFSSLLGLGLPLASIMGTGIFALMTSFGTEAFMAWGWRVPFLLSVVLLVVGVWARLKMLETPEFMQAKQKQKLHTNPLGFLVKNYWKRILVSIGVFQIGPVFYHGAVFFGVSYMVGTLGQARGEIMQTWFYFTFLILAIVVFSGWLGDKLGGGAKGGLALYKISAIIGVIGAYPMFVWLGQGWAIGPFLIGASFVGMITWAGAAAWLTESFPTEVRQIGSGLIMTLGAALAGIWPIVADLILKTTGDIMAVFWIYLFSAVISLICVFCLQKIKVSDPKAPALD